jgi:photosystem II stability/assembly factor-like uncharacterized protein
MMTEFGGEMNTAKYLALVASALVFTACAGGSGGGGDIQPPIGLTYSTDPAIYIVDIAIPPNTPSSSGGAVVSYSVSPALPPGLSLNTSTGVISGTPTVVAASATYTVTASNSAGSASVGVSVTVNAAMLPPSRLTYATNPAAYAVGTAIPANTPSSGGGAVVSYSVSPALPLGLTLNNSTGAISGTPAAVTATATYNVTATNFAGSTTVGVSITVSGAVVPPSALAYSVNPAVYTVGTAIAPNTPISSGGAVVSYSVSPPLPAGLNLNATTGVITGTPAAVTAAMTYTVTAANSAGTTTTGVGIDITTPARAWTHVYPGATRQNLSAVVCFGSGPTCTALGGDGTSLGTTDGVTWTPRYAATRASFSAASVASTTTAYALAYGVSTLFKTTDSGRSWLPSGSAYSVNASGLHFINDRTGWIVGSAGAILKTVDGGATWTPQNAPNTINWYSVTTTPDGATVIIAGGGPAGGMIRRSTDGGTSWTLAQVSADAVASVSCPSDGRCIAACGRDILLSTDGGVVWSSVFASADYFGSVSFADALHGWAVGNSTILATNDGGATWLPQSIGFDLAEHSSFIDPPTVLQAVWAASAERAIIVGSHGLVLSTTDAGSSWHAANRDTHVRVQAIRALDADTVIALGRIVGESFVIERTTDGGVTWNRVASVPEATWMSSFVSAPGPMLYAFGSGTALRSTDGGVSWSALTWGDPGQGLTAVQCPLSDVCWVASGRVLRRTVNSGETWSTVTSPDYMSFAFLDAAIGFAGSLGTQRTINGAVSWSWIADSLGPAPAWARSATEYWGWRCSYNGSATACKLQSAWSDDSGLSWSVVDVWSAPPGCDVFGSSRLPEMLLLDCGTAGWGVGRIDTGGSISLSQFSPPATPVSYPSNWGVDLAQGTDRTWYAAVNGDVYKTSSAAK